MENQSQIYWQSWMKNDISVIIIFKKSIIITLGLIGLLLV